MVRIWTLIVLLSAGMNGWALRDPTMPVTGRISLPTAAVDKVDMILMSNGRRVAVINGSHAIIGEVVGSSKIVDIGTSYVTLEDLNTGQQKNVFISTRDVKANVQ